MDMSNFFHSKTGQIVYFKGMHPLGSILGLMRVILALVHLNVSPSNPQEDQTLSIHAISLSLLLASWVKVHVVLVQCKLEDTRSFYVFLPHFPF